MTWIWIAYVVVGVVLLVPFRAMMADSDDPMDVVFPWIFAVFASLFWPVVAVGIVAVGLSRFIWSFFDKPKVLR
jgi:hypothetical protein